MVTVEELIKFESQIGNLFNNKQIKAPIHLYSGNEEKMIEIFKSINVINDWVCCTWRNHYQAILKGIPMRFLQDEIIKGKSMVMTLPEYKFICSSIVGGIPSIATGIALGNKLEGLDNHVWCWVGDMSSETGAFHESYKYARNHNLPITFIVESNGLSVLTPTDEIWNRNIPYFIDNKELWIETISNNGIYKQPNLIYYHYLNKKYPHAGAGQRVQF
jgi:TPP-dependent pyruvate/acetoin dehydrogenase alpha subunit